MHQQQTKLFKANYIDGVYIVSNSKDIKVAYVQPEITHIDGTFEAGDIIDLNIIIRKCQFELLNNKVCS